MLKVEVPQDKEQLEKQINGLNHLIENDNNDKDKKIHSKDLKELKEALVYRRYLDMQSKEFKEDIKGYEPFKQAGADVCIKVTFTWGWLRVYSRGSSIEWY